MRLLIVAVAALLPLGSSSAQPSQKAPAAGEPAAAAPESADDFEPMNLYRTPDGCPSIPRQVAGEDRDYDATRLDRLPPGKMLLAVERRIDGCPVAVLASEERSRLRR